jgi:hypothetical protein
MTTLPTMTGFRVFARNDETILIFLWTLDSGLPYSSIDNIYPFW